MEWCKASMEKLFLPDDNPRKYRGPPMPPKIEVLHQLAIGLEYIHSQDLVHRDVKPENILIWVGSNESGDPLVRFKWADFGISKELEGGKFKQSNYKGTFIWSAPELLKLYENEVNSSSSSANVTDELSMNSDVFAEGLVFVYYLLDGKHHPYGTSEIPYHSLTDDKDFKEIQTNLQINKPHKPITGNNNIYISLVGWC